MRALLAATAILLIAVPAVAQPTMWAFDELTMRYGSGTATVKRIPYGKFTSRDECEIARARVVTDLDDRDARQPHLAQGQASKTTTTGEAGVAASITQADPMLTRTTTMVGQGAGYKMTIVERPIRIEEKKGVNDCRVVFPR
jgi:hypothetical protein